MKDIIVWWIIFSKLKVNTRTHFYSSVIMVRESIVHNCAACQRRSNIEHFVESERLAYQCMGSPQVLLQVWLIRVALTPHICCERFDIMACCYISRAWCRASDRLAKDAFLVDPEGILCVSLKVSCLHLDLSGVARQLKHLDFDAFKEIYQTEEFPNRHRVRYLSFPVTK